MNKIIIIGNLTKDVELFDVGEHVKANFTVAVNYGKDQVDFFNVIAWNGTAENVGKYCGKGSKVCVCGAIHNRTYEDKDGNTRYTTEITAETVEFLSGTRAEETNEKPEEKKPAKAIARRK